MIKLDKKKMCAVCGRRKGKNYFGKMKIPIGKGKWKKVGTTTILKPIQERTDIVKWTGKQKEVEYWECDKCFNEPE